MTGKLIPINIQKDELAEMLDELIDTQESLIMIHEMLLDNAKKIRAAIPSIRKG